MKQLYVYFLALSFITFSVFAQNKDLATANNKTAEALATPTIAFNTSASKYVDLGSKIVSCVMNDPTDPFISTGLDINITADNLNNIEFTMTTTKSSVVAATAFSVTGTGTARKFKITPSGVGYSTLKLKIIDLASGSSKTLTVDVAVSAQLGSVATKEIYHTGVADGSTAVPVDDNYMFVADDETNVIKLYSRNNSGLPIYTFDVTSYLNLGGKEVDMEASFRSPTKPNRIYWIGSLSNSKDGELRSDRNRIFATDIVGSGATATLKFIGYTDKLRSNIITWGNAKGYNFTAKAAEGIEPKRVDGFNVEGLEIGPDNTTLYIGFRAPYVGTGNNKALICPVLNFETWFGNGSPSSNPTFGNPIELNLNNHGIRSLAKNSANEYLIVAGSYASTGTFELYSWNGVATTAPVLLNADLTNLKVEGIVEVPTFSGSFSVDLISDLGSSILYNDDTENKDLEELNYRKFSTSTIAVTSTTLGISSNTSEVDFTYYPNPVQSTLNVEFGSTPFVNTNCTIYSDSGALVKKETVKITDGKVSIDLSNLGSGVYFVNFTAPAKVFRVIKK